MKRPTHRKICWPDPGLVCLEGGCIFCNESPYQPLEIIEASLTSDEQWTAYRWGKDHDFCNAMTRSGKW